MHSLRKHLEETAELAAQFAGIGCGEWGYLAGVWHDLGKYSRISSRKYVLSLMVGLKPTRMLTIRQQVLFTRLNSLIVEQAAIWEYHRISVSRASRRVAGWHSDETGRQALSERSSSTQLIDAVLRKAFQPRLSISLYRRKNRSTALTRPSGFAAFLTSG